MPEDLKPVLRRQMEVYAGFLEYTDHQVGRLVQTLEKLNILNDTLILYVVGDNGASAEGTLNGAYNEMANFNGLADLETPEFLIERLDKLGGPESYNHYAVGWAHALNTPYQWTKQVASHWGGTRNGAVIHWPNGIKSQGEIRSQFHHVIDVAPTILEVAKLPQPESVNGIAQHPIEGVSMRYTFDDPKAAERHETQYFEIFGNRGIYQSGWTAVTKHRTPWLLVGVKMPPFDDDVWELYDDKDWSQSNNLAAQMPEKLHQLQRQFLIEATRYNVLPLDDRTSERMNSDTAGRPTLARGTSQLLFGGMGRLNENCVLNIKNKSHSVTAEIKVPDSGAQGVIVSQGANIGGWSLYAHDGKLKYCYNVAGVNHYFVESDKQLTAGVHQVRMEFVYAGGGLGKGGKVTLFVDGKQVGQGDVPMTQAVVFSADDGCDVGEDSGAPVSPDYGPVNNGFTGSVKGVLLSIADDPKNAGQLLSAEEVLRAAMSRQ
jgi:arylsulfatase